MTHVGISPFAAFLGPAPDWRTLEVTASDGTRLVVRVMGDGPALLIVHGGMSCAQFYASVAAPLATYRAVHLLERRNYGISANGPKPNSYDVEASDVHSVIDAIGGRCDLFGHSAGALVSLRALAMDKTGYIRKCALYEPPINSSGAFIAPVLAAFRRDIEAGDWRIALRAVLTDVTGSTHVEADGLLDMFSAMDAPALSRLLFAVEAELEALVGFRLSGTSALGTPVWLIGGEKSAQHPLKESTTMLRALLSNNSYVELPEEGHTANLTSPHVLVTALRAWQG